MDTTADQKEIDNFAAMSSQWWDEAGPMAPLHDFAPVRIDYILDSISRIGTRPASGQAAGPSTPLTGLSILDIGCGGGILAEPLARLGATITGIDATAPAIDAARAHAALSDLPITYECRTAEDLAASGAKYDVIYASEVIEHVPTGRCLRAPLPTCLYQAAPVIPRSTAHLLRWPSPNLRWNMCFAWYRSGRMIPRDLFGHMSFEANLRQLASYWMT